MDPIMKLLEDDEEDESMHSGADVEAFTAALNREVEGSASSSSAAGGSSFQPLDRAAGTLPQKSNPVVNNSHGQWQGSVKNDIGNQESQQHEEKHLYCKKEKSSGPEAIPIDADNKQLHSNTQIECLQLKVKQEPGNNAQQSTVGQQQPMQQIKSQQPPGTNQSNSPAMVGKPPVVTFHMLIPILRRYLDKDRDIQVQSIFAKLRKNEVSKEHFLKVIRTIVGDKLLKQAASQYQMQAAQAQRNPLANPSNYSISSQVPDQQNEGPRLPQFRPSSSGQLQSNMGYAASEGNLQKPNETGNMSDRKGLQMLQSRPPNIHSIPMQATQDHVQRPHTFLPALGANSIHSRQFPHSVGGPIAPLRPQMTDSSQRGQSVQGGVASVLSSVATGPALQNNQTSQQQPNKEQKTNSFTPTVHMNKETANQPSESAQSSFAALNAKQVNPGLVSSKVGGVLENQSSMLATPKPLTTTSSSQPHPSYGTPSELNMQIQPSTQAPPSGAASKTPQKKPSAGQKKPLEAIGSSPLPSGKKQKGSGGFHDQSIDQLNDVTAVSGVNLREEEEQLFSAPKEESRVSEAARKVVQLEEERLILQKGPLTKKLAEIMRKYNLKSIGCDVERCLSMCVEERLRGFISNTIRLSKQRVDVEKSRHHYYPLSSDVRSHILRVNREAREQWDRKLVVDANRIRKQSDGDDNSVISSEKDKAESRGTSKHAKTYKEEDDKMRTTAANAAVRVAAGGDDMLSKWQLLAEKNKLRGEGGDSYSDSLPGTMSPHKLSPKAGKGSREQHEIEKRGYFSILGPGSICRRACACFFFWSV
ncbi:transcription initiation factor TFIID subunit 4b-like isoform X3 [Hordeum vulgare subsp. vulgare]|uniref:transcription initiation factor TFIID subunit 4b-like isoform X3 n=1 Tax=Hordeum vulgare subsp. vulgare TaxID=112509 RepID=UPI001D1A4789|nr:transcription initiation factor TFIID subunit 4b-like isoform X3 [Hordeum vulgare subsp. vulgare]